MKQTWIFAFIGLLAFAVAGAPARETLRILAIGNSFVQGDECMKIAASAGKQVDFERIYIGGCSMRGHWNNIQKEEKDPNFKYFKTSTYRDKLKSKPWDIVIIQQASHDSWNPQTYMPYAKNLYDYVKKYAPQAEVVLQQTWSYRPEDRRLAKWKLNPDRMYEKIRDAYAQCAKQLQIRVVPTGDAVQLMRTNGVKPIDVTLLKYPALPDMSDDVVGSARWNKSGTKLQSDFFHLNPRGRYLQGCVFAIALCGVSPDRIAYVPKNLRPEDAAALRKAAENAVKNYRQVSNKQ